MSELDPTREPSNAIGRRGFLAAGAGAFLCTIGGRKVLLSRPGDAAKADAAAAQVKRPALAGGTPKAPIGSDPVDQLKFGTPEPAARRPGARVLDPGDDGALGHDPEPSAPRPVARARAPGPVRVQGFMYQEMTTGFAAPKGPAAMPGPIARVRGRRRAEGARAQRAPGEDEPGRHDAPARRPLHARLRRRLRRRLHARRRLHRPGRGVHVHVGGPARLGRRLALPRPRSEPHAERVSRPVRRTDRPRAGREAPGRRVRPLHAPDRAARQRACRAPTSASTAGRTRATRRRCARRSARTSRST